MLNEIGIVGDVSRRLERAGIPFMLTGSMAMNFYAEPRMTRDIDIVVALCQGDEERIAFLFEPDYYISREAVTSAISHQSLFNLVHHESIIKVDCIVRKTSEYRRTEFDRRRRVRVSNVETWITTKEDLILSKLYWAKDSFSDLQLRDVRNLMATGFDSEYIAKWSAELGLRELWLKLNE